jgi:hypothetical protein
VFSATLRDQVNKGDTVKLVVNTTRPTRCTNMAGGNIVSRKVRAATHDYVRRQGPRHLRVQTHDSGLQLLQLELR